MATDQDTPARQYWQRLLERRKREIEDVSSLTLENEVTFEQVQANLQDLISKHENKRISKFLTAITPTLERVNSFAAALNTLSSQSKGSALTWGTLQIVIEYVLQFSGAVETSLQLIAKINNSLPLYERASAIYPTAASLRWPLQKIFDNYFDCSILMLKEFGQKGLKRFLRAFIPSNLEKTINKKIQSIREGEREFYDTVDQLEREASTLHDVHQSKLIGQMATSLGLAPVQQSDRGEPRYPIRIDLRPNPLFVGRSVELGGIHDHLSKASVQSSHDTACSVIHGLGGQGKSQTALAYYWKYKDDYDVAFWLNAFTLADVERSYTKIARKLRQANILEPLALVKDTDVDMYLEMERAREWFEATTKKWLLIFDNLEDASLIEIYLPVNLSGHGSAIITTQKVHMSSITKAFHKLELQPLEPTDGEHLLCEIWGKVPSVEEQETVRDLCVWVGGLPLAIVTIAGYLKCSSSSITEIFDSLKKTSTIWASKGEESIRNYEKTLSTVFDLALSELSEDAKHLLQIMAFLDPQGVPEELLLHDYPNIPSLPIFNTGDIYLTIRKALGQRQLIKRVQTKDGTSLEIHRSLQLNLLLGMVRAIPTSKRLEVHDEVLSMLAFILPSASRLQQNEQEIWPLFDKYVPQVVSLLRNSQWPDPPIGLDIRFAKMLSSIGTYLWHTGQIRECDIAMSSAIVTIQSQSEDFRKTTECQSLLSDIYLVTGIIADCIGVSRRRESLEQRQLLCQLREVELRAIDPDQVTTDDEIRWGNAQGDLACAYLQRGRYNEAKSIMTMLLEYYKKWGSENEFPFEHSKYYHYLAFILMTEGKPTQALEYGEKAIELALLHAGSWDSTVLTDYYDTACLLFYAGKVEDSLARHEDILQQRLKISGKNSQFTLESYEAVAILAHLLGRNERAAECFKICLSSHYKAIWTTEGIARARYWHSRVLEAQGLGDAAKTELNLALAVKADFLRQYSDFLVEDPSNPSIVFDQMLPIWILQLSGPLCDGGRNPVSVASVVP